MQSYIPIQRQAELHKIMRVIFDDYYYLSLISAQKSNSIAILCYNLLVLPFVLYASQRIACYFCTMKRFLLITIAAIFVHQQQYALSSIPSHRLRYTARLCQKRRSPQHPNNCLRARRISGETLFAFAPLTTETEQTDRHTALVSPLRHISVTSPFGYRRDPFTKRKALHNGLDLKANYGNPHTP